MPVPTSGASGVSSGTAWRCMFAPISARFASSCSRNGISAAATLTVCFGETSTKSTRSGRLHQELLAVPHRDALVRERAVVVQAATFAWAIV